MYTRIRYKKISDDILTSIKTFEADTEYCSSYSVTLNISTMEYFISNTGRGDIVKSTIMDNKKSPIHLNTLKRQVKNALQKLGVPFVPEVRKTRTKSVIRMLGSSYSSC